MGLVDHHVCTIFVPIAAHAPRSAHPSNFETVSHKLVNHIPISISQEGLDVYLWGFGVDSCKNIEINKRPPLMTLLSALGTYWNEYSICFALSSKLKYLELKKREENREKTKQNKTKITKAIIIHLPGAYNKG